MANEIVRRVIQDDGSGQLKEIIVYERPFLPPRHLHNVGYPEDCAQYQSHVQYYEPRYIQPHPQQRQKRRRKARGMGWKTLAMFVCSWIPTGMGWPGLTILAWGLIGVWLFRQATKRND